MNDLNFYGDLIKQLILNKCIVKNGYTSYEAFFNITTVRYFWNYYHDSSVGVPHTDINEPNHWSIIYYLNDNPGKGTIVWKPNEDGTVEEILEKFHILQGMLAFSHLIGDIAVLHQIRILIGLV